jgi:hypothetical protein
MAWMEQKVTNGVNEPKRYVGLTADQKPTELEGVTPWSTFRELDGLKRMWEYQSLDGGKTWSWQLM